jgi:hypothetical protein
MGAGHSVTQLDWRINLAALHKTSGSYNPRRLALLIMAANSTGRQQSASTANEGIVDPRLYPVKGCPSCRSQPQHCIEHFKIGGSFIPQRDCRTFVIFYFYRRNLWKQVLKKNLPLRNLQAYAHSIHLSLRLFDVGYWRVSLEHEMLEFCNPDSDCDLGSSVASNPDMPFTNQKVLQHGSLSAIKQLTCRKITRAWIDVLMT